MGSVSRTLALTGVAMKTGTSLSHSADAVKPVDALFALGKITDPAGSLLIHAKRGGEGFDALRMMIVELSVFVFEHHGWKVHDRKGVTRARTMELFAEQVRREFMGEPCSHCRGHGVLGQKLDTVRHTLKACRACNNAGFVLSPTSSGGRVRRVCTACRGKRYLELTEQVHAGKVKFCDPCAGSGVMLESSWARGKCLGFDHSYILRVWAVRFNTVLAELRRMERRAVAEMSAFLFGE